MWGRSGGKPSKKKTGGGEMKEMKLKTNTWGTMTPCQPGGKKVGKKGKSKGKGKGKNSNGGVLEAFESTGGKNKEREKVKKQIGRPKKHTICGGCPST